MFAGNFAPSGWALCNGETIQISQNSTLFTLIGTTYGGNGTTTFNLPDLRSRVPVHVGTGTASTYILGQPGGAENVTVLTAQIPGHSHALQAGTSAGTGSSPSGSVLAASSELSFYAVDVPATSMNPAAITQQGQSQPHTNLQPFLSITFIISLFGIFPSRN